MYLIRARVIINKEHQFSAPLLLPEKGLANSPSLGPWSLVDLVVRIRDTTTLSSGQTIQLSNASNATSAIEPRQSPCNNNGLLTVSWKES
jgi:hypothetical protein